jgi:hypothetical protein
MNSWKYGLVMAAAMIFLPLIGIAQNDALTMGGTPKGGDATGAFNEILEHSNIGEDNQIAHYYRHHRKLPTFFDGFAVELTTSDLPLRRDYPLFEQFGNVLVDQLDEGGFSYLITGFRSEKAAKTILKEMIQHRAPEATVVHYNKGKRKTKK